MKFTIVTVAYNAGDKLLKTVEDTLKQTYEDFEIIVKDGGSSDGSLEPVRKLESDKIKIFSGKDNGIYDAMNIAVKAATGDYVIFLNCGDRFYSKDVLKKTAEAEIEADNTILYGDTYFERVEAISPAPPKITGFVCYRNIPCHQAIFYSRDVLLNRGFDINYKIRADFEHFSYCYFKEKTKFFYLGFPVCFYEGNGISERRSNVKKDKEEYKQAVKGNIPFLKRFLYRAALILTLHKLRGALANNKKTAAFYQKIKGKIYG